MPAEPETAASGSTPLPRETLPQIDRVLDELGHLAESEGDRGRFYPVLLDRAAALTESVSAALWLPGPEGMWLPAYRSRTPGSSVGSSPPAGAGKESREAAVLTAALQSAAGAQWSEEGRGPPRLLCPITAFGQPWGVLALEREAGEPRAVALGFAPLSEALGELIADFEKNLSLRSAHQRAEPWAQLAALSLQLTASRSSNELAFHLAHDGRQLLGCDRVSVLRGSGGRMRHVASSGVSRIDLRSPYSRRLTQLARTIERSGRPLVVGETLPPMPARWRRELEQLRAVQPAALWAFFPFRGPAGGWGGRRRLGLMSVEYFQPTDPATFLQRVEPLRQHAAAAWNAIDRVERNPLHAVGAAVGWGMAQLGLSRLPRTLVVLGLLAAALVAAIALPVDFEIEIEGVLEPVAQPQVWAPYDGHLRQLQVDHGDLVQAGQALAVLESPQLELDLQRVAGQLQSAEHRLAGLNVRLRQAERERVGNADDPLLLAAQIAELEIERQNLTDQLDFLRRQQAELTIVSPIAGQVVSWDLAGRLADRPVRRGESLMVIGDTAGPWQLEFAVPDEKMRYIVDAQRSRGEPLRMRCLLASDPDHRLAARVRSLSGAAASLEGEPPRVRLIADLEGALPRQPRVGLRVVGRVDCGRRSAWFVWTYELIDRVRERFFW